MKLSSCITAGLMAFSEAKRDSKQDRRDKIANRKIVAEVRNFMNFDGWTDNQWNNDIDQLVDDFFFDNPSVQKYKRGGEGGNDDDVDLGALAKNGLLARTELSDEDKAHMMKFLQLKYTILFLQKQKFIGKYCFYACWCLPTGSNNLGAGYGPPLDNIDKSCREYTTCYNCMYSQVLLGQRCDENNVGKYTIQGTQDPTTGDISLWCMDPLGSCNRSRCECDKLLAEKLSTYEHEWNMQNHQKWGTPPFDREASCKVATATSDVSATAAMQSQQAAAQFVAPAFIGAQTQTVQAQPQQQQVASNAGKVQLSQPTQTHTQTIVHVVGGNRPATQVQTVVQSAPIYGAIVGCCGRAPNVKYFRSGQRCCTNGQIVDANAPCDVDFL